MTFVPVMFILALLLQAAPEQPRGLIAGRVISAQTGDGIGGVQVQVTSPGATPAEYATTTAPDGSFSFQSLPGGQYSLTARKAGHQPAQRLPIATKLDQDESRTGIELKFYRPGVITGHVKDADGLPVIQAEVTAYRLVWTEGFQRIAAAGSSTSDDRGEYRISKLPAGRYLLAVVPAPLEAPTGAGAPALIRTFYPSSAHASGSAPLRVGWDQEAANIDFELRPENSYCVAGRVVDRQSAAPCASCLLRVSSMEDNYNAPLGSVGTARDGSYRICGLPSGSYRFSAINLASASAGEGARAVQVTKSDLRDAHLFLGTERTVTGRLLFESIPEDAKPKETEVVIRLQKVDSPVNSSVAKVRPDSTFEANGLSAGTYTVHLDSLPAGAYLKELRLAGRSMPSPRIEVSEEGSPELEIVAGCDSATLAVVVTPRDEKMSGSIDAVIALFPADNSSPFQSEIRSHTRPNGGVTLISAPPGIYTVYAFTESGADEWEDPEIRRRYPSYGRSVELNSGKRESLELPVLPDIPDGR